MAAPKGNKNALKHGFYSKQFTKEENEALLLTHLDTLDEIVCLRTQANRLNTWLLEKQASEYDESYFSAVNCLVNITIAIGTLLRTQALLTGNSSNVEKAIEEAVLSMKGSWKLA